MDKEMNKGLAHFAIAIFVLAAFEAARRSWYNYTGTIKGMNFNLVVYFAVFAVAFLIYIYIYPWLRGEEEDGFSQK